jgi:hypothetical protein
MPAAMHAFIIAEIHPSIIAADGRRSRWKSTVHGAPR